MLPAHQIGDLAVDLSLRLCRTCQRGVATQVLVGDRFHCNHIEIAVHAVARNHCARQLGRLLDVVGSAG